MYRLTGDENTVLDLEDMAFISAGSDRWELYQAWLADGNTPEPQFTEEEIAANQLREATEKLNALTRQANAQITALSGRINTLDWLINVQTPEGQEEAGEEYTEPTPEDIAELAAIKPRYTKWISYNVKLGKVKAQATWPVAPAWPVMPEPYTSETSAAHVSNA